MRCSSGRRKADAESVSCLRPLPCRALTFLFHFILLLNAPRLAAQESLRASFDWSMPDRFGLDENQDGLIDYYGGDSIRPLDPGSWRVDFTACDSAGDIASHLWSVDGELVAETASCDGFSHDFPAEGIYTVSLTVVGGNGNAASATHKVVVQDWLIVAIGDSYGAGSGAPDLPLPEGFFDQVKDLLERKRKAEQARDDALEILARREVTLEEVRALRDEILPLAKELIAAAAEFDLWCNRFPPDPIRCPAATDGLAKATAALERALRKNNLSVDRWLGDPAGLIQNLNARVTQAVNDLTAAQEAVEDALAALDGLEASIDEALDTYTRGATWHEGGGPGMGEPTCQRSAFSAQARAALQVELGDPRTSVTFLHLSCGGARITGGATDLVDGQIPWIVDIVGKREIDALLVSIGGNDAGFGKIAQSCVRTEPCYEDPAPLDDLFLQHFRAFCAGFGPLAVQCAAGLEGFNTESALKHMIQGFARLDDERTGYAELQRALEDELPPLPASRVTITEYPNTTRDEQGNYCDLDPADQFNSPGISRSEWQWIDEAFTRGLNERVAAAAKEHRWTFVGGIHDASRTHGYCAAEEWTVRLEDAYFLTGISGSGVAHPTRDGYAAFGEIISMHLAGDFYPGGDRSSPRRPAMRFHRGDPNSDGAADLSDAIAVLGFLFLGEPPSLPCKESADTDNNGGIDISDGIQALEWLFIGGPEPAAPGPTKFLCGFDPDPPGSPGDLGCETYGHCGTTAEG